MESFAHSVTVLLLSLASLCCMKYLHLIRSWISNNLLSLWVFPLQLTVYTSNLLASYLENGLLFWPHCFTMSDNVTCLKRALWEQKEVLLLITPGQQHKLRLFPATWIYGHLNLILLLLSFPVSPQVLCQIASSTDCSPKNLKHNILEFW